MLSSSNKHCRSHPSWSSSSTTLDSCFAQKLHFYFRFPPQATLISPKVISAADSSVHQQIVSFPFFGSSSYSHKTNRLLLKKVHVFISRWSAADSCCFVDRCVHSKLWPLGLSFVLLRYNFLPFLPWTSSVGPVKNVSLPAHVQLSSFRNVLQLRLLNTSQNEGL